MSWDDSLTGLLDLLVRNYPDPASRRVVAEKAGRSTGFLSRAGDIRDVWMSILRDASQSRNGLRDLARVVRMDLPDVDFPTLVRPIDDGVNEVSSSHEHRLAAGLGPGLEPTAGADRLADLHEGIVHPLPSAPLFVGRVEELDAVRGFWRGAADGHVLALIGLGGAGKTAIASAFVSGLLDPAAGADRPDGLFVWSFYVNQDVSNFLRHAYRYFSRGLKPESSGAGLLYRLTEMLDDGEESPRPGRPGAGPTAAWRPQAGVRRAGGPAAPAGRHPAGRGGWADQMPDHHPVPRPRPPRLGGLRVRPAGGQPARPAGGAAAPATARGPGGRSGGSTRCSTSTARMP